MLKNLTYFIAGAVFTPAFCSVMTKFYMKKNPEHLNQTAAAMNKYFQ